MATISGTSGSDTIAPGLVSGGVSGGAPGAGADSITGSSGNDSILGDAGDDSIFAGNDNDRLFGGSGDDLLGGGAGSDFIDGGTGFDVVTYTNESAGVTVLLQDGALNNDATVTSALGVDTLRGVDQINGSALADRIVVATADTSAGLILRGGAGSDFIQGLAGGSLGLSVEFRGSGITTGAVVDLAAGRAFNDGTGGTDTLVNINYVRGTDFNDTLLGTTGNDRVRGRGGDDFIDAREGTSDRADFSNATGAVSVNLALGRALDGEGGFDTILNFEQVYGAGGNDTLIGDAGSNLFAGFAGNDRFFGLGGEDRVAYDFGSGSQGGPTAGVTVNLVSGIATGAHGGTDTLVDIERVTGTAFADSIVGGAETNRFRGLAGNDTMNGGLGADFVEYIGATAGATVNLTTGIAQDGLGGTDRVLSIANAIGGDFNDLMTGVAQGGRTTSRLRGGEGADTLVGIVNEFVVADYADQTRGLSVNLATGFVTDSAGDVDRLINIRGALMFQAFNDTLVGSASNDWFSPSGGNDSVNGGAGLGDIVGYDGNPTGGVSVNLLTGRANDGDGGTDTLIGIEGVRSAYGADTIIGNALNNLVGPGSGADSVNAGLGQDTISYSLGFSPGALRYATNEDSDSALVLSVTIDLITLRARDYGGATDTILGFEHAVGGTVGDILRGSNIANFLGGAEGNDTIEGRLGNDTLDGGLGNDRMLGGTESDTYIIDAIGDVVIEAANQGTDTVRTGLAVHVLPGNVENLVATNAIAHTFTGNAFDNAITGGGGADTLNGGLGNDTLDGGLGIDRLIGSAGNDRFVVTLGDVVVEALNQGTDTVVVQTGTAHTLGLNIEDLVLGGATLVVGNGNALNNVITGNALGNTLQGLAGADSLVGLGGNDTLVGGTGRDTMTGGTGADQFRFAAPGESTSIAPDLITDFTFSAGLGFDRIDLRLIDANSLVAGNQAFTFNPSGAFTGAGAASAGELVVVNLGANVRSVRGDTNGDGATDFAVVVNTTLAAQQGWFFL